MLSGLRLSVRKLHTDCWLYHRTTARFIQQIPTSKHRSSSKLPCHLPASSELCPYRQNTPDPPLSNLSFATMVVGSDPGRFGSHTWRNGAMLDRTSESGSFGVEKSRFVSGRDSRPRTRQWRTLLRPFMHELQNLRGGATWENQKLTAWCWSCAWDRSSCSYSTSRVIWNQVSRFSNSHVVLRQDSEMNANEWRANLSGFEKDFKITR